MAELQLSLNEAERECLVSLLERARKETLIEEHRTRAPAYREHIVEQEDCIEGLLNKLQQPAH